MLYQKHLKPSKVNITKYKKQDFLPHSHPHFATQSIHAGQEPESVHGSINVPIHLSSTYAQHDVGKLYSKFDYTRCGNPTRDAFEQCMAALQYGQYAIAHASGCGALTTVMHLIKTGEHVIICDDVYGGTQRYLRLFSQAVYGIQVEFVDMTDIGNVKKAIKENTRLIWVETPTNPTLKLIDLEAVALIGKQKKILTVADNTFCNPYLQSPLLLGIDVVVNSCTKYLGGHSDIVMGVIVLNDKDLHSRLYMAAKSIGANPSPFDCYMCLRGIKTLEIRTQRICENAFTLAHYLETHPLVQKVYYPGLKSHPQHELAKKQMRGYGGMVSFLIKGGLTQSSKFLRSLKIFTLAESLGGVESLAELPAVMTHGSVPPEKRKQLGILDNFIRLSLGIQSLEDIFEDVQNALESSTK